MKIDRKAWCFILIFLLAAGSVRAVFVTDLIGFSKMALEYSKQLKTLKEVLKTAKKIREDFDEFTGKFAKIHSGLKKEALNALLNFRDIEFYFNSPYVSILKDREWKDIWKNRDALFKKYKYLRDHSVIRDSNLYKKNAEFRERADLRIEREEQIYSEYRKALDMLADTREALSAGKDKYKLTEDMIRKFSTQRSTGKLTALICDMKLDQMIKMDILLTSFRMKMELALKESIIRMDTAKKREIEVFKDLEKERKPSGGIR